MYSIICRIQIIYFLSSLVLHSHGFLPMLQERTRNSLNAKGSSYYPHWFIQSDDNDNIDTCDLTADFCDTNCCSDKECEKYQKEVFECTKKLPEELSSQEQVDFECNYQSSEKRPWWLYFLCYVRNNSPFHVKFFEEDEIIKTLENMKEKIIGEASQSKSKTRNHPHFDMEGYLREGYWNDNAIVSKDEHDGNKERFFLLFPSNILSSMHCANIPLKYLEERNTECLRLFSDTSCTKENGELNLNDYLIRNKSSRLLKKISINLPRTVSFQENFHFSDIFHKINCSMGGKTFLVASKYFSGKFPLTNTENTSNDTRGSNRSCDMENVRFMAYNKQKNMCENVLVGSRMNVFWNGTSISKIHINYHLADIPVPIYHLGKSLPKSGRDESTSDYNFKNQSITYYSGLKETMDSGKSVYNQKVIHFFVKQTFRVEYQHVQMNDSATGSMKKHHSRDINATGYLQGEDIAPYIEKNEQNYNLELVGPTENGTEGFTFGLWKRGEFDFITLFL